MTDATIERVARALCLYAGQAPDGVQRHTVMMAHRSTGPDTPPATHPETIIGKPNWTYFVGQAEAALTAAPSPDQQPDIRALTQRVERLRLALEGIAWMDEFLEFLDADGAKAMMNLAREAIRNDE